MNNQSRVRRGVSLLAGLALFCPVAALAQDAPPLPAQGPLVVERVRSPLVVAANYKVTDLDGELGQLAGIYAGRAIDSTLFIGGAGHWLVNGSPGDGLTYGGLLVGWSIPVVSRIRFGTRGLVGFGSGSLSTNLDVRSGRATVGGRNGVRFGGAGGPTLQPTTVRVRVKEQFFVFEPQADVLLRLTDRIGLHWAGGYRLTGLVDVLDDRLDGATGSLALQVEW